MGWITEVRKIELDTITNSVLVFLGVIAPGFLVLYLYKPELIETLDIAKLVIFSSALTLPLLVINVMVLMFVFVRPDDNFDEKQMDYIIGGTAINILVYYGAIVAAYEKDWPFLKFLGRLAISEVVVILFFVTVGYFVYLNKKKTDAQERENS